MKKIVFACALLFSMLAQAHVTDEYHWYKIAEDDKNTISIAVENFDRRRSVGIWMKTEKIESWGTIKAYRHFTADCKKNIVFQNEVRVWSETAGGDVMDETNRDIGEVKDDASKRIVLSYICKKAPNER